MNQIFNVTPPAKQTKGKVLPLFLALLLAACCLISVSCANGQQNESASVEAGSNAEVPDSSESQGQDQTQKEVPAAGLWADALYRRDTEFGGEGKGKTISVRVVADGQSVTFTVHTDAETLGAALLEQNLIEGEQGTYGLYIKKVNGMLADYDVNRTFWSIRKNGTDLMTGADGETISDGGQYEFVYSK